MTTTTVPARACAVCRTNISHRRADADTCSPRCRKALSRMPRQSRTTYHEWAEINPNRRAESTVLPHITDAELAGAGWTPEATRTGFGIADLPETRKAWKAAQKAEERALKARAAELAGPVTVAVAAPRPGVKCPGCPVADRLKRRGWRPGR